MAGKRSHLDAVVVDHEDENGAPSLLGMRFIVQPQSGSAGEQRQSNRWICSDEYLPQAVAAAPGRFNEFLWFQIRNVSRDGIQLHTGLEHRFLSPGMNLRLTVTLPMVGETQVSVRLVRIRIAVESGKEVLEVGAQMINPGKAARSLFGQYLLQFSSADSTAELERDGFLGGGGRLSQVHFHYLKLANEFREVLDLRMRCSSQQSVPAELGPFALADRGDRESRIVAGRHRHQLIATARVHFPTGSQRLEVESLCNWDISLPRIDEIIEVSRICVEGENRHRTLMRLIKFICETCVSAERSNVVVSVPVEAEFLFRRAGWAKLEPKVLVPGAEEKTHIPMIGNPNRAIRGSRTSPLLWNFVWHDVLHRLIENGSVRPVGIDRAMLACFRVLRPAAAIYFLWQDSVARYIRSKSAI